MNILPKIIKCPLCKSFNWIKVNGITYENHFHGLQDWTFKKKFNCKKCNTELGLFTHNLKKIDKLIWIDYFKCEDIFFEELRKLQIKKEKFKKNEKKYHNTLDEIRSIQNKIQLDRVKLKIKYKIQSKGMLIRHID